MADEADIESMGFLLQESGSDRMMRELGRMQDDRVLFLADGDFDSPGYYIWDPQESKHLRATFTVEDPQTAVVLTPITRELMDELSRGWSQAVRLQVDSDGHLIVQRIGATPEEVA